MHMSLFYDIRFIVESLGSLCLAEAAVGLQAISSANAGVWGRQAEQQQHHCESRTCMEEHPAVAREP